MNNENSFIQVPLITQVIDMVRLEKFNNHHYKYKN